MGEETEGSQQPGRRIGRKEKITQPLTLNAQAIYYSQTWCPNGYKPSKTQLDKRKEYLIWKHNLEQEAAAEVRAGNPKAKREAARQQKANAPKGMDGNALW